MREKVIDKLLSGKFLLTVFVSITTCVLAITGKINGQDWEKIALIVMYAYFTKNNGKVS